MLLLLDACLLGDRLQQIADRIGVEAPLGVGSEREARDQRSRAHIDAARVLLQPRVDQRDRRGLAEVAEVLGTLLLHPREPGLVPRAPAVAAVLVPRQRLDVQRQDFGHRSSGLQECNEQDPVALRRGGVKEAVQLVGRQDVVGSDLAGLHLCGLDQVPGREQALLIGFVLRRCRVVVQNRSE